MSLATWLIDLVLWITVVTVGTVIVIDILNGEWDE